MTEIRAIIEEYAKRGADPNSIQEEVAEALEEVFLPLGWNLWGDDSWRIASACSICGSPVPGICGHEKDPSQIVLRGIEAKERYRQPT